MAKTPSRIRVALFFTTLDLSGTEQQASLLLRHYDRKQFECFVYAMQGGPLEAEFLKLKIPVRILDSSAKTILRDSKIVRSWIHMDDINILHCLLWHPNIIGRFACRGTNTKCINSVRWAERVLRRDWFDHLTRQHVDWWIANSTHGADIAKLPHSRTTIIANGLDTKLLETPLTAWKPKSKTAVMIASFRREKRFDVFVRAAAYLPDWHFTLVGDGPQRAACERLAAQLQLKNITFAGKKNALEVLRTHEVSVLLSRSEGSPNVTLESLAMGVPFVGSNIPAHQEILAPPTRGLVCGDLPESVAHAISSLHDQTMSQRLTMRKAQQMYVRKNYTVARMVAETEAVWTRVAKQHKRTIPQY